MLGSLPSQHKILCSKPNTPTFHLSSGLLGLEASAVSRLTGVCHAGDGNTTACVNSRLSACCGCGVHIVAEVLHAVVSVYSLFQMCCMRKLTSCMLWLCCTQC